MKTTTIATGFTVFLLGVATGAGATRPAIPSGQFPAFEVENFENPRYETEESLPDDWRPIIREDIVQAVIRKHQFRRVMDFEDPKVPEPEFERVLLPRGKII